METYYFFDGQSGIFTGRKLKCDASQLEVNTPETEAAWPCSEGEPDPLSQRVNLATQQLEDWRPSRPLDTAAATWDWDDASRRWVATPTLAARQADAMTAIDAAAGAARRRYITDVPGQQAVYLRKLEQARTWLATPEGDPPAYIAAEAVATGLTPTAAAQAIVSIAALWDEQLSPAIEGARIAGKRAVSAATDAAAVADAVQSAIAALDAIHL